MAAPASPAGGEAPRVPEFSSAYARYALGLLLVVYVFNFIDRQIVTILLEAIKHDLALRDWQLGFFSGTAFAIFYATLGLPIARLADVATRRNIISLALCFWSAMTALQGLATTFWVLILTRIGVGVGEAGCSPPAHSMISDFYAPPRRATALSTYALGIPIGGALGLFAGGWLREVFDWRVAFAVVGLPGVLLAVVVRLTLREPTRGYWEGLGGAPARAGHARADTMFGAVPSLLAIPAFLHMSIAGTLHAFYGYGAGAFNPAFLERVHRFGPGELGTWLALIGLTAGALGTFLGGWLVDRFVQRDVRSYAWIPGIATLAGVPFVFAFYLWPERYAALAFGALPAFFGAFYLGPTFAVTQAVAPPHLRALASAVMLLLLNLIGLGLGPQVVGAVSDLLAPRFGAEAVRYALLGTIVPGALWSCVHYALAARTLGTDLAATRA